MEPEVHKLKVKKKDLMQFADKMPIMLRAGVSLSMAMDVMVTSEKNRRNKKIYRAILTDLYGGASLADSMRTFAAFPDVVVNMVASGEKTGKLDWAFSRIAELYEKELAMSGKVSSAFTYPLFLVFLMIALFCGYDHRCSAEVYRYVCELWCGTSCDDSGTDEYV